MPSGKAPKHSFEAYWEKYSVERKQISDFLNTRTLLNPVIIALVRKLSWVIYQPYKWLFIVPFLVCSTAIISCSTVITAIVTNPRIAGYLAAFWARINSYVTPMSVKVNGLENIDEKQSYIIVANHLSLYDIYVLYGWIGIDIRWVMKKELKKVPFIGFVCTALKHVYIDRSNTKNALESINNAKKMITNGTSIIFFPEGSRSKDGKLQTFKKGAFKLALEMNLPILPVTINGTHKILGKETMNLMPGAAEMIIHKPIDTSDYDKTDVKKLTIAARNAVKSGLKH